MKCDKCGTRVEPGNLNCARCNNPIPQVVGASASASPIAGSIEAARSRRTASRSKLRIVLITAAVAALIAVAAGFFVFVGLNSALNSSEANRIAVSLLKQSPAAADALGQITEVGWPYGELQPAFATLYMSVKGTKASGRYFASLKKANGEWILVSARLELQDGTSINIIPQPPGPTTTAVAR